MIAAVHGFAVGVGFSLISACDYRIASRDAVFQYSEVASGVLAPSDIGVYEGLPWALACEFALLGRRLTAARLHEVGMLNEVVDPGSHESRAEAVAAEFLKLPQDLLRASKELMLLARPHPPIEVTERRLELTEILRSASAREDWAAQFVAPSKQRPPNEPDQ